MNVRPIREGLFDESGPAPRLVGGHCSRCGHVAFPAGANCENCGAAPMERRPLSNGARLICATRVHMPTQHFAPGFAVGYVRLDSGQRLFTQLAPELADRPEGTALRLQLDVLWTAQDQGVRGYRFVAAEEASGHA